ncbi:NADP-dependent oxidoreductase [Rhodoplanes sp. TEM]|uniref:NADP-dependent oxidoreductase n=1 Tax=Rhodoplanes tepidamans TaxID=200616 RepID=A0ABT5JKF1_RHOTP|nr:MULTISPECIES: NADP-dependent oxidoreductase [Rhodoplanes]MDC7789813.1 NADP-dependent oxidoreductase [Rhodoplanes tepidamans]MDC7985552.1 NADP-dependent oxidoreductase [Rhodoplanes sp. TEM]MDQ0355280.1 NADPH-dependent curcumin reductase CurA [Rhodoplanes tepidamans]
MTTVNRRWLLARRPEGLPDAGCFALDTQPVPAPGPGQILVRARFLSVDPYMRGRMSRTAGYAPGVGLGEVMRGGGVGEVVASNHPAWAPGDIAESMAFGWQEYAVLSPDRPGTDGVHRVDPALAPIESALSWLGMPGMTAYFGLLDVGRPRPGDTVVVSAASGAVGQLVGQIARLSGCRAVAIAGSARKLDWCREIGFDAGIDHRTADLRAALKETCPDGVDVFFDNTSGPIHDAVMRRLSIGARVVLCGRVALAARHEAVETGERHLGRLIATRASLTGFLVYDWWHRRDEALARLAAWHRAGQLKYREDVLDGIARMPEAFLRLLTGENFGKQLVRVV